MAGIIYCHQCAQDNPFPRKFCLKCGTPLHLQDNPGDALRSCQDCGQTNPSFAKFCTACSSPLVRAPSKGPGPNIPLILINRQAAGGESCPGCGRPAEPISQLVQREGSKRSSYLGPDGIIAEKPSWLEWNMREPQRIPAKHKGFIGGLGSRFLLLVLAVASPCLFISLLRTIIPSLSLNNPLVLLVAFMVAVGLAWTGRSNLRKAQLGQAQFRWRRARYCSRCDAVFVTGETMYTGPRQLEDILWHSPAQFA